MRTPAAKAELKLHAQRLAKLNRIKLLAQEYGFAGILARVNVAIKRENKRHNRKMTSLHSTWAGKVRWQFNAHASLSL